MDLGEAKCEEAYFDLIDGYIKNIREACDQDNYTTPRWNETHWLGHEGRMKLTFCSVGDAEYARKEIESSETLAGKYQVEEKRARVPLMMNMENPAGLPKPGEGQGVLRSRGKVPSCGRLHRGGL